MDVTSLLNTTQQPDHAERNHSGNNPTRQRGGGVDASRAPPSKALQNVCPTSKTAGPSDGREQRGTHRSHFSESYSVPRSVDVEPASSKSARRASVSEHHQNADSMYEISSKSNTLPSRFGSPHERIHPLSDASSLHSSVPYPQSTDNSASTSGNATSIPIVQNETTQRHTRQLSRQPPGQPRMKREIQHSRHTQEEIAVSSPDSLTAGLSPSRPKFVRRHESSSDTGRGERRGSVHSSTILRHVTAATAAETDSSATHDATTPGDHLLLGRTRTAGADGSTATLVSSPQNLDKSKPHRRATSSPDLFEPSKHTTPEMLGGENPRGLKAGRTEAHAVPLPPGQHQPTVQSATMPGGSSGSSLSSLTPEPHSRPPSQSPLLAGPSTSSIQAVRGQDDGASLQAAMPDEQWEEPCCMFVKDCNTGSQLRKAISHLFGRNKSCTLRIPKKIWVYYCRKHYQRVRYRNAKTYPLNQMELVKLQIRRLRTWSVENQRGGSGPYIKTWTLSLRKREKNRLNQNSGANAVADAADDGEAQAAPAAPEWLLQRLGSGYTTEQMMEIADHLHEAIKDGSLSQVPEIEFLPDIKDPDEEDGGATRPVLTRKQSRPSIDARPPKRKASILSNVHAEIHPPSPYWREQQMASKLQEKRARIDKMAHPYRREPVDFPGPSSGVGLGAHSPAPRPPARDSFQFPPPQQPPSSLPGVQFLHQEQDQGHGGHGMSVHERAGASTGAYNHGQQGPSDRHFGPKPTQPAWEWETHRTGHFRLPSISAQLPPEQQTLTNVSIPPAHSFHRGLEAGPGDQDRSHMVHQHRPSATLPPVSRLDPAVPYVPRNITETNTTREYEGPVMPREPWQHHEQYPHDSQGGYRHAPATIMHPQHFQHGATHEYHPGHPTFPPTSQAPCGWTHHQHRTGRAPVSSGPGEQAQYAHAGWQQQEVHFADNSRRNLYPPPS